jgi:hypothetical protein
MLSSGNLIPVGRFSRELTLSHADPPQGIGFQNLHRPKGPISFPRTVSFKNSSSFNPSEKHKGSGANQNRRQTDEDWSMKTILPWMVMLAVIALAGCDQKKSADPNMIETKLSDGRTLHYTREQLKEAEKFNYSRGNYEADLAAGLTHDAIIKRLKEFQSTRLVPGETPQETPTNSTP